MKVKCTKKMAAELNRAATAAGKLYRFELRKLDQDQYAALVGGDLFTAYDYGDYDPATGTLKAIAAIYPAEYYAGNRYITTQELRGLYASGDTLDTYTGRVVEAMAI